MTPEQFAYWLQGHIELNGAAMPTQSQWDSIVEHHRTIFTKVTTELDLPPMPEIPAGLLEWPEPDFTKMSTSYCSSILSGELPMVC